MLTRKQREKGEQYEYPCPYLQILNPSRSYRSTSMHTVVSARMLDPFVAEMAEEAQEALRC